MSHDVVRDARENREDAEKWRHLHSDLNSAIRHAMNYHGLDAKLNMADFKIADLITPEVLKWLRGETDVQVIERMSPEDRASIGAPPAEIF